MNREIFVVNAIAVRTYHYLGTLPQVIDIFDGLETVDRHAIQKNLKYIISDELVKLSYPSDNLLIALEELAGLIDDVRTGDYKPDSFTNQLADKAIAEYKASRQ